MTTPAELKLNASIETIARAYERFTLNHSPFHLGPCGGCGAPAFQQPCSICRYYPCASDPKTIGPFASTTREVFCAAVERSGPGRRGGNLGTWLADSFTNNVGLRDRAEDFRTLFAGADFLDAGAAFDLITATQRTFTRGGPNRRDTHACWSAIFEVRTQVIKSDCPDLVVAARDICALAVVALHDGAPGVIAGACTSLAQLIRRLVDHPKLAKNGNLIWAARELAANVARGGQS